MAENIYKQLSDEYNALKAYRQNHVEQRMQENIQLVSVKYGEFATDPKWEDKRFDTVGTECSELLGEGIFGNMTPSAAPSFKYRYVDEAKNKGLKAGNVPEKLTEYMMGVFARSTYYSAGPEWFTVHNSLPVASLDIREDKAEGRLICTVDHPRAVYIAVNASGSVETVYLRRFYTADQAAEMFGEQNLDDDLRQALSRHDTTEYEFIECVKRRAKALPGSPLARDWKYGEYTFRMGSKNGNLLLESGTKTFPKAVLRWSLRGGEPYAWTAIDQAMPDIRTCNQMVRLALTSWQKEATPPKWVPKEGVGWRFGPDSTNIYQDPNRVPIFPDVGKHQFEPPWLEMFQGRVRKALKVDHFLMLMQIEAEMTAREVVERKREGMSVTQSVVGRIENEGLDRLHERALSIEWESGRLQEAIPDIPSDLFGADIKVEYLGPLSQQQKQIYAENGILSAIESCAPVFTLQPETRYKIKGALVVDKLFAAKGAPSDILRNDEEYQGALDEMAKRAAAAQQAAAKQAMAGKVDPNVQPQPGSPAEAMLAGQVG